MADSAKASDRPPRSRSPLKTKVIRAHKILPSSPREKAGDLPNESDESADPVFPLPRSHTPGHLASKGSHSSANDRRHRRPDAASIRQRSQSASHIPTQGLQRAANSGESSPKPPLPSVAALANGHELANGGTLGHSDKDQRRLAAMRSTSAIASRPSPAESAPQLPTSATASAPPSAPMRSVTAPPRPSPVSSRPSTKDSRTIVRAKHTAFPSLQQPDEATDVPPAPASGMYWSKAPVSGAPHTALRAHTTTLIGSNIYVFGGCDARTCFNTLYVLDADSFHWSVPYVVGDIPMPLRAMTCTAVGKKLVVFGGGDGPAYYNDVYVLDTVNFRWTKPRILGDKVPSKRRAHTACLYKNGVYVFGGGDGVRALNDIWRLDVSDMTKMTWKLISSADQTLPGVRDYRPKARGYHTSNMVGSKLIIFGGSDGGECFDDVWVYDVDSHFWKAVNVPVTFRRLSHTATVVGSYLFVIGGHDGNEYSCDVLLLNLVTMLWDKRKVYGMPPTGRGYHGAVLYDSRVLVIGGFDGSEVFGDVLVLELAVHAYYSQISHFTIEV